MGNKLVWGTMLFLGAFVLVSVALSANLGKSSAVLVDTSGKWYSTTSQSLLFHLVLLILIIITIVVLTYFFSKSKAKNMQK